MTRVLLPLPRRDFDPTEAAVPWRILTQGGHLVTFATPDGAPAQADPRMLDGGGLGPLKLLLMADARGVAAYREMEASEAFRRPLPYARIRPEDHDALLLPGGHAKGMREYLESEPLQRAVAWFFDNERPVGAVCHGTLLAARSRSQKTGRSVLWGRKTTGLNKRQELLAWWLTRAWLGDYYRTYPTPLEDEVRSFLKDASDFLPGPLPLRRDGPDDPAPGFTVRDGNYLSARWPGDAHAFAAAFLALLR